MPSNDDYEMFLMLSGGCSLDSSPGKNWVEENGGLPEYICRIAKGIMKSGKSKSQAIAIAVSRVKAWAAGGDDVDADTRAKAAKAVAQWTALKAKNKKGNVVKATRSREEETEYLMLTYIPSYNTEIVRRAWDIEERKNREEYEAGHPEARDISAPSSALYPYSWVKEVWSDYIIVECDHHEEAPSLKKIPFRVNPLTNKVTFGTPVHVAQVYVEIDDELNENEKTLLADLVR